MERFKAKMDYLQIQMNPRTFERKKINNNERYAIKFKGQINKFLCSKWKWNSFTSDI